MHINGPMYTVHNNSRAGLLDHRVVARCSMVCRRRVHLSAQPRRHRGRTRLCWPPDDRTITHHGGRGVSAARVARNPCRREYGHRSMGTTLYPRHTTSRCFVSSSARPARETERRAGARDARGGRPTVARSQPWVPNFRFSAKKRAAPSPGYRTPLGAAARRGASCVVGRRAHDHRCALAEAPGGGAAECCE